MNFNAVTQFLLAHFQNPKTKGNCPINYQGTARHSTAQNKVNVNKEEDADSIKNYLCTVYSLSTDVLGKCLPLEASTSIYCKGYWGKTNKNGLRQLRYPESKAVQLEIHNAKYLFNMVKFGSHCLSKLHTLNLRSWLFDFIFPKPVRQE